MASDFQTLRHSGEHLMSAQRWLEAVDHWAATRTQFPDVPFGYSRGADALIMLGRFDEAWALGDEMYAALPHSPACHTRYAILQCRRGDWAGALATYQTMQEKFPQQKDTIPDGQLYRQALYNTVGIPEGYNRLPPTRQNTPADDLVPQGRDLRKFMFVSGMPRAGTSAMGRLLNIPGKRVLLFTELYNPYLSYDPACFTNAAVAQTLKRKPKAATQKLLSRLPTTEWIGDKRPLFHYGMLHTMDRLKDHDVVVYHMLRNVAEVCLSYQKRADKRGIGWDPARDVMHCLHEMNIMHRLIIDLDAQPRFRPRHKVVYVDYKQVFCSDSYAQTVFAEAGIDITFPGLHRAIRTYQDNSRETLARPRAVPDTIRAAIADKLDFDAARKVEQITGICLLEGL